MQQRPWLAHVNPTCQGAWTGCGLRMLVLVLLWALQTTCQTDGATANAEATALLAFKSGISNAAEVPALATWSDATGSPCSWGGVSCAPEGGGNVTSLVLLNLGMEGTIAPNSLSLLSQLASLDLSANSLRGPVPDDWNKGKALALLRYADLSFNQLSRAPEGWGMGGCSALQTLLLGDNALATLPPGWSFPELQLLALAGNTISGSIPPSWNLSSSAQVVVLPQNGSSPCGVVPPSPTFLYDDGRDRFPLSNTLGSCFAKPGNCTSNVMLVSLLESNLYDAAMEAGATVQDTAALNPGIDYGHNAGPVAVKLPCYQRGSPVGGYLGSDVAFQRPAWGSAEAAWLVNSLLPPDLPQSCYSASGPGAFWQVDLGSTFDLTLVVLGVGAEGIKGVIITVNSDPDPAGNSCVTDIYDINPTVTLLCAARGRYLRITGSVISLCSVQVYATVSSASVNKQVTYSAMDYEYGGENFTLTTYGFQYTGPQMPASNVSGVICKGRPTAAYALDLGYQAAVAGVYLWNHYNVGSLLVSNSSLNSTGGVPPGVPCQRGSYIRAMSAVTMPDSSGFSEQKLSVLGANNGTFYCEGTIGQYIIAVGYGGTMQMNGIEVYLAQQPGGVPPLPGPPPPQHLPPPSPPPSPAPENAASTSGAVIGGAVAGALLASVVVVWWYRRGRVHRQQTFGEPEDAKCRVSPSTSGTTEPASTSNPQLGTPACSTAALPTPDLELKQSQHGGSMNSSTGQAKSSDPLLALVLSKLTVRKQLMPDEGGADPVPPALGMAEVGFAEAEPTQAQPQLLQQQQQQGTLPKAGPSGNSLNVDMKLWTVGFEELDFIKQIGEGGFGQVYLAKWNETMVAAKLLLNTGINVDNLEEAAALAVSLSNPILYSLRREASMMAALRHPNIVGFLGVCPSPPCVLSEYCSRGSLHDILRAAKVSPAKAKQLDWSRRLKMALDAAKGMLYLHARNPPVIHRDLKSPNLLVDSHWGDKVCDFNLSKILEETSAMSSAAATNPRWLAPEILAGESATFASDVYSFGVVLWELLTWEIPWGAGNPWQVVTTVSKGGRLDFPPLNELPGDSGSSAGLGAYIALTRRCWAQDLLERPMFPDIITQLRELLGQSVQATRVGAHGGIANTR